MRESSVVEVYASADGHEAHLLKNALEDAGIQARVVGDQLQSAGGELPLGWTIAPRIWVAQADEERARQVIATWEDMRQSGYAEADSPVWDCPHCGEEVEGNFDVCWHCQHPRNSE